MISLYVLGEKMMDVRYKNRIIRCIFRNIELVQNAQLAGDCEAFFITGEMIRIMYRGTTDGSPGRRLLVDLFYWLARSINLRQEHSDEDDFIRDVLLKHDAEELDTREPFTRSGWEEYMEELLEDAEGYLCHALLWYERNEAPKDGNKNQVASLPPDGEHENPVTSSPQQSYVVRARLYTTKAIGKIGARFKRSPS